MGVLKDRKAHGREEIFWGRKYNFIWQFKIKIFQRWSSETGKIWDAVTYLFRKSLLQLHYFQYIVEGDN